MFLCLSQDLTDGEVMPLLQFDLNGKRIGNKF